MALNWCTSPMNLHKITPSVENKMWLKWLDTQLNGPTKIKIQLKSPTLLSQQIRNHYYKTLETRVINNVCKLNLINQPIKIK